MEQTENLSLLKRWWNPFPVKWFDVDGLIKSFATALNATNDRQQMKDVAKILSYNKVLLYKALYMGIYNLIVLKPRNDQWGITKKGKTNLSEYLALVKKYLGFDIKGLKDLERLKNEVQRMTDKYMERFGKEKTDEAIPFMQYAFSVFAVMESDYNPNLTIAEFVELVRIADIKLKEMDKIRNKYGKH